MQQMQAIQGQLQVSCMLTAGIPWAGMDDLQEAPLLCCQCVLQYTWSYEASSAALMSALRAMLGPTPFHSPAMPSSLGSSGQVVMEMRDNVSQLLQQRPAGPLLHSCAF